MFTHTVRPRAHDKCESCGRWSYDRESNYCMSCGWSYRSPIYGVLKVVFLGLAALAILGWLMS